MTRTGVAALLVFAPPALAQPGGGFRMAQGPPSYRPPVGGQVYPAVVPRYGFAGGYGYGGFGYGGGYYPFATAPLPRALYLPPTTALPFPLEPSAATVLSGQLPATLIVQFPAAARLWVDGVEVPGDPDTEWTLTSRVLRPGETATFKLRGRWTQDGRALEAAREVALGPGARSRLLVVSGSAVNE